MLKYKSFFFWAIFTGSFSGCDWSIVDYSCCSGSHPCGVLEGDCDHDYECFGSLLCGYNNCFFPFESEVDCCYDPTPGKIKYGSKKGLCSNIRH